MAEVYGWVGKILRVDLSKGIVETEDTIPRYAPKFIGGLGIGLKVAWDEVPMDIGALDPENRLVFATGPLTGTPAPTASRVTVTALSPECYPTPEYTHSSVGGGWGAELKYAGFDAVVFKGKAEAPVYLWVHNGEVEIRDARSLWGLNTFATQSLLSRKLGDSQVQSLVIGPAGENLCTVACIVTATGNVATSGFGAVMGSKNLKAIAVRGTGGVKVARPKELLDTCYYTRSLMTAFGGSTPLYNQPTLCYWNPEVDPHDLNRQGFRTIHTKFAKAMIPRTLYKYHVKNVSCTGCPVSCYDYLEVPGMGGGRLVCDQWFYPGYGDENQFLAKQLCDKLGLDIKQAGHFLLWYAQKMYKAGKVTEEETGIAFSSDKKGSDAKFLKTLYHAIAYREGWFGDLLSHGSIRICEKMGLLDEALTTEMGFGGYQGLSIWSYGGLGFSEHYDRRRYGYYWAVYWAVSLKDENRHMASNLLERSGLSYDQIRQIAKKLFGSDKALGDICTPGLTYDDPAQIKPTVYEHITGVIKECLTLCDFIFPITHSPLKKRAYAGDVSVESRLYTATTGIKTTREELNKAAERVWNLYRAISIKRRNADNMRTEHDAKIPEHFFLNPYTPPQGGITYPPLDRVLFEKALSDYYREVGWNPETGLPTRRKLEDLDLKDVADDLTGLGLIPQSTS